MEFLGKAGYLPEKLGYLIPMQKSQGSNEEKKVMRDMISSFLSRVLKGTFPQMTHYTYFQSGTTGFEHIEIIPALDVYFAQGATKRNDELLLSAKQCGVVLPELLQNKIDYALSSAIGEAERGKMYELLHMAPNMERADRQQALDDLGDNKHTRRDKEAAAKMARNKEPTTKKIAIIQCIFSHWFCRVIHYSTNTQE